jgi:hypothetical protein
MQLISVTRQNVRMRSGPEMLHPLLGVLAFCAAVLTVSGQDMDYCARPAIPSTHLKIQGLDAD